MTLPIIPVAPEVPLRATVIDMIRAREGLHPNRDAVICGDTRRTWAEFRDQTNRVAQALIGLGIAKGDRVAILSPNSVAAAEIFIGTLKAGAIIVPLSSMASKEALGTMAQDCGAKVLFLSDDLKTLGEDAATSCQLVFNPTGAEWQSLLSQSSAEDPCVDVGMEDGFNIIYSSGTTGVPKGILHSHRLRAAQMDRIEPNGYDAAARTLLSTPLCSNTTLVSFLPTLAGGSTVVLMAKFDAGEWLRLAETEKITHTMLVPVLFRRLLDHPDFPKTDLSNLQRKFCTSAPLREGVKREVLDRMPGKLMEFYGLTEGGGVCVLVADETPHKLHTVGKPAAGVDIRIISEDGEEVAPGITGEIVGRGPSMMSGYWNRADLTEATLWQDQSGAIFFRSGDMGHFDNDGFLTLSDRKKDVIISGGFNIYADDLERILLQEPDVIDAAVVGIPSDEWGETPMGFVVLKAGANRGTAEIREAVNAKLGKFQRIQKIEIVDTLPRSEIGKILKRELRATALK